MSNIPSIAMIPSAYKSGKLYSVLPSDGSGDFNFARTSEATRVNQNGLIETVGSNVPRIDYPIIDGVVSGCPSLLLEPQRSNLFTYSEAINQGSWSKSNVSISENTEISPDGTQNADTFSVTSGFGYYYQAPSLSSGSTVTQSIFVKNIDADRIILLARKLTTSGAASFYFTNSKITSVDLTSGISANFEDYGNGWYRIYLTCTTDEDNEWFRFQLPESGNSCYVWGAMLEQGSFPTSYIPSLTGSQTTRSAETCNGAGNASTFNDSEGVIFADISALANDGTERRLSLQDNGTYDAVRITFTPTANSLTAVVYNNGANQFVAVHILDDATTFNKIAIKYKQNDFALWVNGIEVATDTNGSVFSNGSLDKLSYELNGIAKVYAKTKDIRVYNTALTDAELEKLTSYDSFRDMAIAGQYKTY